jgi:hypothetical protein
MSEPLTLEERQRRLEERAVVITAALVRARRRAEDIARRTGTKLVQMVDGKIVRVDPPPVAEDAEPSGEGY